MTKLTSLTIFFPAYNEEKNIKNAVIQAIEIGKKISQNENYEVIVINDGSTDSTAAIVNTLSAHNPKVKLITHGVNQGYGGALMTGFTNATKDWVFFSDSDGQFDLSELETFLPYTDTKSVIIGYRIKRNDPPMRILNARAWNFLNRFAFGLIVKDIDCAFKLFKRESLQEVLPEMHSRGAMISAELLIRLKLVGYDFVEVGVNHYPRTSGSPTGAKASVIYRAFRELAQVYRGDLGIQWVKQVIKFFIVGTFNTVLDICIYLLITRFIPAFASHKMWAKGVSYIFGLFNSFIFNRALSFKSEFVTTSFLPFIIVGVASLAINTGVMYVFYESLKVNEFLSLGIATVATLSWNFLTSKFIVFKD